jgi:hypothetical protein
LTKRIQKKVFGMIIMIDEFANIRVESIGKLNFGRRQPSLNKK